MYYIGISGSNGRLLNLNLYPDLVSMLLSLLHFPKQKVQKSTGSRDLSLQLRKKKKYHFASHTKPISWMPYAAFSLYLTTGHRDSPSPHSSTKALSSMPSCALSRHLGFLLLPSPPGSCSVAQKAQTFLTVTYYHLTILFPSVSFSFPLHSQRLRNQYLTAHLFL